MLVLKADSNIPAGPNVTFIPLKRTASGWMIQIGGNVIYASTDRVFTPGVPLLAQVLRTKNGIQLKLLENSAVPPTALHPLIQYLTAHHPRIQSGQLEKLQKIWPRAPGRNDAEKARLLWELEERGLMGEGVLQGFQELYSGQGGLGDREEGGSSQREPSSERNPEGLIRISKASAACDLWTAASPETSLKWLTVPFRWQGPQGEKKGLSRFQLETETGLIHQWNFSVFEKSWAFHLREIPLKSLSVFHPPEVRGEDAWKKVFLKILPEHSVKFFPFTEFDGYGHSEAPKVRRVDEIV